MTLSLKKSIPRITCMQKNDEKALTNSKFSVTLKITKTINENVYYKLS